MAFPFKQACLRISEVYVCVSLRLFDFQSYKDNNTSQSIPKGQEGCERMAGEKSRAEENLRSFFKCLKKTPAVQSTKIPEI